VSRRTIDSKKNARKGVDLPPNGYRIPEPGGNPP
jgi:hypothetical protein